MHKIFFLLIGFVSTIAIGEVASAKQKNPTIEKIVGEISAQRIEATIRKLASFGTRHTLSETESDTRGIGAARRWIKAELERCSKTAGGRLKVEFAAHLEPAGRRIPTPTEIVNVVATLPGKRDPDRFYVVSGHYDSRASDVMDGKSDAPGANDDASGTAAVIEMACVMARYEFDASLVFMAVAGEEQGLLGANHWAEQAVQKKLNIAGMITNDIIGNTVAEDGRKNDHQVRLFANGFSPLLRAMLATDRGGSGTAAIADARKNVETIAQIGGEDDTSTHQLGRYLKEVGERYVSGFKVNLIYRRDRYLRGGDHLPFLERGYAAVRFTEPNEDYRRQHQDVRKVDGVQYGDLPEFVDYAYVAKVTRVNAAGLTSLALAPAAPSKVGMEVAELSNDTTLRWDANQEDDLAGYQIVWRDPDALTWQQSHYVGKQTRHILKGLSKDNYVFGVQAVDRDGNASLAVFPKPIR